MPDAGLGLQLRLAPPIDPSIDPASASASAAPLLLLSDGLKVWGGVWGRRGWKVKKVAVEVDGG